jgi:uncharacterized SAM-binding protein YcdF (DUF218 family)
LLLFGGVLLLAYAARGVLLPPVARFLDVSEPPKRADYVMVLGGGNATRPLVAAALWQTGLVRQVLVPRDHLYPEAKAGIIPSEFEVDLKVLKAKGVPSQDILVLDGECTSTFDEAQALVRFLGTRPPCSIAVVTTTYHTRRSRWVFRQVLGERAAMVHFVAAPPDGFDESDWWRTEAGFAAYAMEYVKLVFYWLNYHSTTEKVAWLLGLIGLFLLIRRGPAAMRHWLKRGVAKNRVDAAKA